MAKGQLVGYFDSLENSNFFDALKIAKSLRFEDINFTEIFTFEIFSSAFSPSTQIPVRVISDNWFESTWLGTFYDYQNNWVYHPKLGWIYSIPSSLEGIWIWSPSAEWLWGNSLTFPYLFSEKSRDWIFLNSENKAGALAYDFDQKTWSNWSTLNLKQRKFSPAEQRAKSIEFTTPTSHSTLRLERYPKLSTTAHYDHSEYHYDYSLLIVVFFWASLLLSAYEKTHQSEDKPTFRQKMRDMENRYNSLGRRLDSWSSRPRIMPLNKP